MDWSSVLLIVIFIGLAAYVFKLQRDLNSIRDAADAALEELEDLNG